MPRTDRRELIADAALGLAAEGGNRAVTHQAVDRRLDLPKGSTSYYFRTRGALISAMAQRLIDKSRVSFAAARATDGDPPEVIVAYLGDLVTARRQDVLARYALLSEPGQGESVREDLARCFFSFDAAVALMDSLASAEPETAADRLIAVLEGVVFAATLGRHAGDGALPMTVRGLVEGCLPRR